MDNIDSCRCSNCNETGQDREILDEKITVHRCPYCRSHCFVCRSCGLTSTRKYNIVRHYQKKHPHTNESECMDVSFDDASTSQCVDDSSLFENELDSKVDEEPSPSTREFKTGDCDFVANDDLSEDEFLIDLFTSDVEQEETTLNPVCISQHQNPNLHSLEQFESVFANSDCKSNQ